jgi:hypothetical protein
MKKYWVFWTYIANYGGPWEHEAESAEHAAEKVVQGFSEDFAKRGSVFVFDHPPVFTRKGEKL